MFLSLVLAAAIATSDAGVIVEFRQAPRQEDFDRLRRDVTARQGKTGTSAIIRREYRHAFHGAALRVPRAMIPQLRALPYVKSVHADKPVEAFADSNIETIGAVKTWSTLGSRGAGVTVAIIDTGIDYTHPALGGGFGAGHKVIGGFDFVNDDADPLDDEGHGTHVAGIVAANLDDVSGVAPDATLLAYKVLDANGRGNESDVIAAIERALDPNADGDLSDHALVANLSLGGSGNPDDAASIAVDNAVKAGMVVCVAAGNSGAYHGVASPGTARDAITAGAVDNNDALATFSAKGPAAKLASIKPDVVAPGVSIRSTYMNGGYAFLSGTSMATPHVAGAAALLRALHPDWTPAEVKSALMMYGKSIQFEQITQGGGRIDVARAAQATVLASPASISFGLDADASGTFARTQRIRVTNRGAKNESVALSVDGSRRGVAVTIAPAKLELAAGASAEATISISVTNDDTAPITSDSFAFNGLVHLDTATTQTHLPWALIKASRATVTTDAPLLGQLWLSDLKVPAAAALDDTTTETLLPAGDYDLLLLTAEQPDEKSPIDEAVIALDKRPIRGDVTIAAPRALASHAIAFNGVDANGTRLFREATSYVSRARIVTPPGSWMPSLDLPSFDIETLHVSDLSPRWKLLAVETVFDREHSVYTTVSHRPLIGVTGDVELRNAPADLLHAPVKLAFTNGAAQRRVIVISSILPKTPGGIMRGVGISIDTADAAWTADLYTTADADRDFAPAFHLQAGQSPIELSVPPIVARGDRLFVGDAYTAMNGEPLAFGVGPLFPRGAIAVTTSQFYPFFGFNGQLGESRMLYDGAGYFVVRNSAGNVIATGTPASSGPVALSPGVYTISYTAVALNLGDRLARADVVATIDCTAGNVSAPSLASMSIADSDGRSATTLAPHAGGMLKLATAATSVKASFRYSGAPAWTELPISFDHADLAPATNVSAATVDLRIELADAKGNKLSYILAPAFTVGDVPLPPRRRP